MVVDNDVISRLDLIKQELDYIKENMVQKDEMMNFEEFEAFQRSFDKKNLVSSDEAKKQLGL